MRHWWSRLTGGYRPTVEEPIHARRVSPLPRPARLARYEGLWVAVIGLEVVAAAETSQQLALMLNDMDHRRRSQVVIEFVRPTTDSYVVGAG